MFYKYEPNEEDKDIVKFSANVIVPAAIMRTYIDKIRIIKGFCFFLLFIITKIGFLI